MNFKYDLFISYHSKDNNNEGTAEKGWITSFQKFLESILFQMLGEKLKFFSNYDKEELTAEALQSVAIFILVISPDYVADPETLKEARLCAEAVKLSGTKKIDSKSRILKIVKMPVPKEQEPDFLRPLLGYDLYNFDPETGRTHEFNSFFGPEAERMYWMKLADLAYDIYNISRELKIEREINRDYTPFGKPGSVYLADTGIDLIIQRDIIRRELVRHGFRVLPEETLPFDAADLEKSIKKDLKECRLSIHLFGDYYGEIPRGADKSIAEIQNMLAAEHDKQNTESGAHPDDFVRLVWMPSNVKAESDKQANLLEQIRRDADAMTEAEILQTPLEDLKSIILNILVHNDLSYVRSERYLKDDKSGRKKIYLVCDQRDHAVADEVKVFLTNQGCEVLETDFKVNNVELRHIHQDYLTFCDGVIVLLKSGTRQWLISKLLDVLKAPGFGRKMPLKSRFILSFNPDQDYKKEAEQFNIPLLNSGKKFNSEVLFPILSKLQET